MSLNKAISVSVASALLLSAATAGLAAQATADTGGLEEVIVTAQKTTQTAQKVSRAIDVQTAEDIAASGASTLQDVLENVPGYGFAGFQGQPAMRGIGNDLVDLNGNAAPVVAVNMDGSGLSGGGRGILDSGLSSAAFDIDRVEVVRGPSGTMQGQNALAGAINVVTRAPKLGEWDFNLGLQVGNYNQREYSGGVNIPMGDTVALRVAFQTQKHDSYSTTTCAEDIVNGPGSPLCSKGTVYRTWGFQDQKALRAKLLWKPSDTFRATLGLQYSQDNATDRGLTIVGNPNWSDPWNFQLHGVPTPFGSFVPFMVLPSNTKGPKIYRYNAEVVWDLPFMTVTESPVYTTSSPYTCTLNNVTGTNCQTDTRMANELRLQSRPGSKIEWQVGYYFDRYLLRNSDCATPGGSCTSVGANAVTLNINQAWILQHELDAGTPNPVFMNGQSSAGARDTKSVYASIVLPLTDATRLRAGMRYAKDNSGSNPLGYFLGAALPTGGLNNALFTIAPGGGAPSITGQTYAQALAYLAANGSTAITCSNCTSAFTPVGPYQFNGSSSPINWNVMWEWDQSPTAMFYTGVTTGYSAGGVQTTKVPPQTYPPESVVQFSIGDKARFRDNTVQWNTEAYYYLFKNYRIQANVYDGSVATVGGVNYTNVDLNKYVSGAVTGLPDPAIVGAEAPNNIGLRTQFITVPNQSFVGVESTLNALVTPNDKIDVNVNLSENRLGYYVDNNGNNYTGTQTANSPVISGYLGYRHTFHVLGGKLEPHFIARYTGYTPVSNERYFGTDNLPYQYQKAYWKYDANMSWDSDAGHWGANLFINNIANSAQSRGAPPLGLNPPWFIPFLQGTISPPRTYGLSLNYKFH